MPALHQLTSFKIILLKHLDWCFIFYATLNPLKFLSAFIPRLTQFQVQFILIIQLFPYY